jgi:hypothetical protein
MRVPGTDDGEAGCPKEKSVSGQQMILDLEEGKREPKLIDRTPRPFRVHARKGPGALKRVPQEVVRQYQTIGQLTALRKFRWDMEDKYGVKARDYFPGDLIVIEEV